MHKYLYLTFCLCVFTGCTQKNGGAEVIFSGSSPNASQDQILPERFRTVNGLDVIVARTGDTLATLAKDIGTDAATLKRYNGVPDNAIIASGAMLAIPPKEGEAAQKVIPKVGSDSPEPVWSAAPDETDITVATSANAIRQFHTVEKGDTAYGISRDYGIDIAQLDQWNGMGGNFDLKLGQVLAVTAPASSHATYGTASTLSIETANIPRVNNNGNLPPSANDPLPKPISNEVVALKSPDLVAYRTNASNHTTDGGSGKFGWPLRGKVQAEYGVGSNGIMNDGIDIAGPVGAGVFAAEDGVVSFVQRGDNDTDFLVLIQHQNNYTTVYTGLDSVKINEGSVVKRGQKIAVIAAPKNARSSGIHFEIRQNAKAKNPQKYLGS